MTACCAGRNHFIGGKLVPSSIDAYLVMEFADGGDLFGLRGQLAATEVGYSNTVYTLYHNAPLFAYRRLPGHGVADGGDLFGLRGQLAATEVGC